MERREFTKAVASLPVIPSLPSIGKTESDDEYWEIDSTWHDKIDLGRVRILKNGDIEHRWEYTEYEMWQKIALLNSRTVANRGQQSTNYVADLFDLSIEKLYIDPPYFFSRFSDEDLNVQIRTGKYSEYEYVYVIERHDEDALQGTDGGADSIEEVVSEVSRSLEQF